LSGKGLDYPTDRRNTEMAMEFQWNIGVGKFMTITPDLQLYPNPGLDEDGKMGLAVGLRTTIML
jgi:carbohydrate-selective porin OprB